MMSDGWTEVNATNDETWDGQGTVEGKYISKKSEVGPNKSMMYTLVKDGKSIGVWGSTVIDSKLAQIPVGSEVRIKSLGMATSQAGKSYKDYSVMFRPAPFVEAGGSLNTGLPASAPFGQEDEPPIANYDDEVNVNEIPF